MLVATNRELTESEAKAFGPVYEDYQKELQGLNQRIVKLLESYAADYRKKSLTDEAAKKLIDEYVAIEQAEGQMKSAFVPKLNKALPAQARASWAASITPTPSANGPTTGIRWSDD